MAVCTVNGSFAGLLAVASTELDIEPVELDFCRDSVDSFVATFVSIFATFLNFIPRIRFFSCANGFGPVCLLNSH